MINKYFEVNGELNNIYGEGYKPRPQQINMANAVMDSLKKEKNIVVEAGTGVGKSLAYLIPLAHKIKASKGQDKGLISVGTKNLQSQLWSDRGIIEGIFDVKVAMIKGRTTYPCLDKLSRELVNVEDCTNDDMELISPFVNKKYWSDKESCTGKSCDSFSLCPYRWKRSEADEADIVITNNTLTILNIISNGNILGEFTYVVFDEAHELPDAVRNTLSSTVTPRGMKMTAEEGNVTSKKFYKSIDLLAKNLTELSSGSFNGEELTSSIASKLKPISEVTAKGTDEKTENSIKSLNKQINRYNSFLEEAIKLDSPDKYYSFNKTGINEKMVRIDDFFTELNNRFKSIIFTSATMFEENTSLNYFKSFVGETFPINKKIDVGTVFDFDNQMKLWCSESSNKNDKDYPKKISEIVKHLHKKTSSGEGIVVLFTSIATMDKTAALLEGYSIHKQHRFNPDFKEKFLEDPKGILFGVKSCWTGMDIKGDKLKYLIIAGLPFEAPNWEFKKVESYLSSIGRNPFLNYSVPKMINTLRQGIGRLIRTVNDAGEVIIMDNNLLSGKSYAKTIIKSLPTKVRKF